MDHLHHHVATLRRLQVFVLQQKLCLKRGLLLFPKNFCFAKLLGTLKNIGVLGACFMQTGHHKAGTALAVFFVGDKDEKACGFVRPTSESPNKFSFSVKKAQFVHVGK